MKQFLLVLALTLVPPPPKSLELPLESIRVKETTATTALDEAFKKLALPCPYWAHANEILGDTSSQEEGHRFHYRPDDLCAGCEEELDALAKTKEPIDERLLEIGNTTKEPAERYRVAWVLIQRRNGKVVPILEKMAGSASAEERYLAWHAYTEGVGKRQLGAPRSVDTALGRCEKEKNPYVRSQLFYFLGACKAKEAIPLLTAALDGENWYAALCALGEIRDPKTVPAILARAREETLNPHVYYGVLGRIGTPEAVDYLLERLEGKSGHSAAEALFETGSPKALPALERHLRRLKERKEPDESDLAITQISVLRLKNKDPRQQLLALAEDRAQSESMRTHALEALGHYDKKPFAERVLKLYRDDTDDWRRIFYIRFLSDVPGEGVTAAMIDQALTDNTDAYQHCHADLLRALNQRLNTSFRSLAAMAEHLRRERAVKDK